MPSDENKLDLEISYEEQLEARNNRKHGALAMLEPVGMEALREKAALLDRSGFAGDADVVLLGLEDMEPELTMEQAERQHRLAPFIVTDRHRYQAIPMSQAPIDDARAARENDIDDMTRPEWRDEE